MQTPPEVSGSRRRSELPRHVKEIGSGASLAPLRFAQGKRSGQAAPPRNDCPFRFFGYSPLEVIPQQPRRLPSLDRTRDAGRRLDLPDVVPPTRGKAKVGREVESHRGPSPQQVTAAVGRLPETAFRHRLEGYP